MLWLMHHHFCNSPPIWCSFSNLFPLPPPSMLSWDYISTTPICPPHLQEIITHCLYTEKLCIPSLVLQNLVSVSLTRLISSHVLLSLQPHWSFLKVLPFHYPPSLHTSFPLPELPLLCFFYLVNFSLTFNTQLQDHPPSNLHNGKLITIPLEFSFCLAHISKLAFKFWSLFLF